MQVWLRLHLRQVWPCKLIVSFILLKENDMKGCVPSGQRKRTQDANFASKGRWWVFAAPRAVVDSMDPCQVTTSVKLNNNMLESASGLPQALELVPQIFDFFETKNLIWKKIRHCMLWHLAARLRFRLSNPLLNLQWLDLSFNQLVGFLVKNHCEGSLEISWTTCGLRWQWSLICWGLYRVCFNQEVVLPFFVFRSDDPVASVFFFPEMDRFYNLKALYMHGNCITRPVLRVLELNAYPLCRRLLIKT